MNAGFFSSLEHVSSVRAPMLYEATDKPRVEAGAEPCRPAHGAAVAIVPGQERGEDLNSNCGDC